MLSNYTVRKSVDDFYILWVTEQITLGGTWKALDSD